LWEHNPIVGGFFMKNSRWLAGCALLVFLAPVVSYGQGTSGSGSPENTKTETTTPAKLQIVLSDYDGTAKVSSLAYTIPLIVSGNKLSGPYAELRIGIRVPVATAAAKTGESTLQYIDVGTNIDARVAQTDDGRYQLDLRVDRSSLYVAGREQDGKIVGKEWSAGEAPPNNQPMVREYRGGVVLSVREGQATEATVATDPLTGHVLKVEVTLSVVK
jgi:hypothetical protein